MKNLYIKLYLSQFFDQVSSNWPKYIEYACYKNYDLSRYHYRLITVPLPSRYRFLVIVTHRDTPLPHRSLPSPPPFTVLHRRSPSHCVLNHFLTVDHRLSPLIIVLKQLFKRFDFNWFTLNKLLIIQVALKYLKNGIKNG